MTAEIMSVSIIDTLKRQKSFFAVRIVPHFVVCTRNVRQIIILIERTHITRDGTRHLYLRG